MYCAIQEDRYVYTCSSDVSTYKYCTVLYERIGMYIHSWIFFNLVCIRMAYTGISLTGILPYILYSIFLIGFPPHDSPVIHALYYIFCHSPISIVHWEDTIV